MDATVQKKASKIRLLVLDVDGVCTDGKLVYGGDGTIGKIFHAHDGIGIKTAHKAGILIGVITGRDDACVRSRVESLKIEDYYPGFESKGPALEKMVQKYGLSMEECAYLGDDWIDLDPMSVVGLPMAVANARPEVKAAALYVTQACGGEGAVREAIELLLAAQGKHGPDFWVH